MPAVRSSRRRFISGALSVAALSGCGTLGYGRERSFRPDPVRPLAHWQSHVPGAQRLVDHSLWTRFLATYRRVRSDRVPLLPYGEVASAELELLDEYLALLAGTPVGKLDRPEQYAFWLNLYNALTVRLIERAYLVLSIRDIDFGDGTPWHRPIVEVESQRLSLADIRDRILRAYWRDGRLHYGLCYGAIGSPGLLAEAFTGENVDRLLDAQALDFVNHPRGVWVEGGNVTLSSIFDWYAADFGGTRDAILAHLRLYALPGLRPLLRDDLAFDYAFDWSLNDATGSQGRR
ncbi:DUF547 domain-containing protein [Nisaea acidiphila]|uniref:DUF547 domain-containing protein n=1 Tax=Nisaea acidiphila TaxID=1862145 RepID=A0A9J7AX98_9PROT|nr:DUF547 domain-containing protein [Nisaea acidiphila]UUX50868.1 DUF547 domain-containing protein [Nisaea acidiphila]